MPKFTDSSVQEMGEDSGQCSDLTNLWFIFVALEWELLLAEYASVLRSNTCIHWSCLAVKKRTNYCSLIITLFMTLIYGIMNAYSIKHWSFEMSDWAHLFFSLCELLLISILFFSSFYFKAIHLFFCHYVIVIKYFANVCCL